MTDLLHSLGKLVHKVCVNRLTAASICRNSLCLCVCCDVRLQGVSSVGTALDPQEIIPVGDFRLHITKQIGEGDAAMSPSHFSPHSFSDLRRARRLLVRLRGARCEYASSICIEAHPGSGSVETAAPQSHNTWRARTTNPSVWLTLKLK